MGPSAHQVLPAMAWEGGGAQIARSGVPVPVPAPMPVR